MPSHDRQSKQHAALAKTDQSRPPTANTDDRTATTKASRSRWPRRSPTRPPTTGDEIHDRYEQIKQSGDTHIAELQRMSMAELIEEARKENLTDYAGIKKQDLIFKILKERVKLNGLMYGEGTLEVLPDGFGFLRSPDYHYLSCPDDIYVSPSQIRRFGLKTGATVSGQIRPPKENERYFALLRVEAINYQDPEPAVREGLLRRPDAAASRQARSCMETTPDEIEMRVVDLIVPIGFGQRGLDRQPAAGRQDDPHAEDGQGRAEELSRPLRLHAADRRAARRSHRHGAAGQGPELRSHQLDLRRAGRAAHPGLGDGARKGQADGRIRPRRADLPRFDHAAGPGLELRVPALGQAPLRRRRRQRPAAAQAVLRLRPQGRRRRLADDHRHRADRHRQPMDEVIFEEFKGTGNLEIVLDRKLVDQRIWPAIDINRSGTRSEEMLLDPEEHRRVCILRRVLNDMNPPDAMELLVTRLQKTKTQRRVPDEHES